LPRLLDQILDAACRLTHADAGIIGLYDAADDVMRTATVHQSVRARRRRARARRRHRGHIIATGQRYHGAGDLAPRHHLAQRTRGV
jgi:hypothetical protein